MTIFVYTIHHSSCHTDTNILTRSLRWVVFFYIDATSSFPWNSCILLYGLLIYAHICAHTIVWTGSISFVWENYNSKTKISPLLSIIPLCIVIEIVSIYIAYVYLFTSILSMIFVPFLLSTAQFFTWWFSKVQGEQCGKGDPSWRKRRKLYRVHRVPIQYFIDHPWLSPNTINYTRNSSMKTTNCSNDFLCCFFFFFSAHCLRWCLVDMLLLFASSSFTSTFFFDKLFSLLLVATLHSFSPYDSIMVAIPFGWRVSFICLLFFCKNAWKANRIQRKCTKPIIVKTFSSVCCCVSSHLVVCIAETTHICAASMWNIENSYSGIDGIRIIIITIAAVNASHDDDDGKNGNLVGVH